MSHAFSSECADPACCGPVEQWPELTAGPSILSPLEGETLVSTNMSPTNELREPSAAADEVAQSPVLPLTIAQGHAVMPVAAWRDCNLEVALDSGAVAHVMDAPAEVPGYPVFESPGSRRGESFVGAGGAHIPNEGEVHMNLETSDGGVPLQVNFQSADICRPLMSVSKICDQGYTCTFTKDGAQVMDNAGKELCRFKRSAGLYVAEMKVKPPEPFHRQAP